MYSDYSDYLILSLDDIFGIRSRYDNRRSFSWGKHRYIWITPSEKSITRNFKEKEFFSECQIHEGHWIDSLLVVGLQEIREVYGSPIIITSSYRDFHCNRANGGASKSQHLYGNALDFKFSSWYSLQQYQTDILNNGCIFGALTSIGITGYGLYDGFCHIDSRDNAWQYEYFGNEYNLWGTVGAYSDFVNPNQCELDE